MDSCPGTCLIIELLSSSHYTFCPRYEHTAFKPCIGYLIAHASKGRAEGGGGLQEALYELPTKLRVPLLMQDYTATLKDLPMPCSRKLWCCPSGESSAAAAAGGSGGAVTQGAALCWIHRGAADQPGHLFEATGGPKRPGHREARRRCRRLLPHKVRSELLPRKFDAIPASVVGTMCLFGV